MLMCLEFEEGEALMQLIGISGERSKNFEDAGPLTDVHYARLVWCRSGRSIGARDINL
jgi:hypothetical protein